jgi:diguanylate cyclase (GGDEF)-like protein/PAS domain S-box-containing protein
MAADVFEAPISLVTLLDSDVQWFKAKCGTDLESTERDVAFCNYTILSDELFIVRDTLNDERFAAHPLVTGAPHIRFYAGAPLVLRPGIRLGSLCVIDQKPRELTSQQRKLLLQLAEAASAELRRHRKDLDVAEERDRQRALNVEHSKKRGELSRQKLLRSRVEITAGIGSWDWDLRNGEVTWSDGLYRLLGYEPGAIAPAQDLFMRHIHPEDLHLAEAAHEAIADGAPVAVDFQILRLDGEIRWLSSRAEGLHEGSDGATRMVGILCDITEARKTEANLRTSEERYRALIDVAASVVWHSSGDGATSRSWGWDKLTAQAPEEELVLGWLHKLHPDDRQPTADLWQRCVEAGQNYDTIYRVQHVDGSYRWCRAQATPIRYADSSIREWVGMISDIDERFQIQQALQESEKFSENILRSSPDSIKVLDLDGRVLFMNEASLHALEISDISEVSGKRWPELWPLEHRAEVSAALAKARNGYTSAFSGYSRRTRSGAAKWCDVLISPIIDGEGRAVRLLVISRDNTDAKSARDELHAAHEHLAAALESTTDNVIVLDHEWLVLYMNERAVSLVGRDGRLSVGKSLWDAYPEQVGGEFHWHYQEAMDRGNPVQFEAFLLSLGLWLEVHAFPTRDGISIFFRDITEARRAREEITHLAHHDPLTDLPNRTQFNKQLAEIFASSDGSDVAILVLDLDGFKEINDSMGHPAGDMLLQLIANRLRPIAREAGLLARLGGDEFAIIQAISSSRLRPAELADGIISILQEPFVLDGNSIRVGVSIGIAVRPRTGQHPDDLFKQADIALYQAKADGGGSYRLYEAGMQEQLLARQAMKRDLALALERGELEVFYQPLMDLSTDRICSFEALLRWHHPTRGTVSPAEFIPLAEETGLIVSLGEWVLQQACRDAMAWPDHVSVSVNVSPVQFKSQTLPLRVAQALGTSGLSPSRLLIEITESVLLNDTDVNLRALHQMKDLGAGIALDDFGTGFSSLSYIRNFPFDKIKIDRSFVGEIGCGHTSEVIIRAVLNLGRSLKMTTTAEGVETAEQLRWLRNEGCHEAQGYLLSRPIPLKDVAVWLEQNRVGRGLVA